MKQEYLWKQTYLTEINDSETTLIISYISKNCFFLLSKLDYIKRNTKTRTKNIYKLIFEATELETSKSDERINVDIDDVSYATIMKKTYFFNQYYLNIGLDMYHYPEEESLKLNITQDYQCFYYQLV